MILPAKIYVYPNVTQILKHIDEKNTVMNHQGLLRIYIYTVIHISLWNFGLGGTSFDVMSEDEDLKDNRNKRNNQCMY